MVNVLSGSQKELALKFAQGTQQERFANQNLERGQQQHPRFEGVLAWFDCRLAQVVSAGDHDILLGEVKHFGWSDQSPLLFAQSKFGQMSTSLA